MLLIRKVGEITLKSQRFLGESLAGDSGQRDFIQSHYLKMMGKGPIGPGPTGKEPQEVPVKASITQH
jgi:hypothetical protein